MPTHEVLNQTPPRAGVDEFAENTALVESVARLDAEWSIPTLHEIGRLVGTEQFQSDAKAANERTPVLKTHDRYGNRIDEVEYDESYHRIIGAALSYGAHSAAWADPRPGANVARAAAFMLFAQIEPGHACPVSMTHAVVPALANSAELSSKWLPKILSREYHPGLDSEKPSAIFGMGMTEKQGGSDVRSNTTTAKRTADGSYRLTGHKWFCSAPMSDAFLVLAQAPKGLSCFLLPRVLDDGTRNTFNLQRLKDKLGNRSNASAEVEFS
ncbi:MAG: acyl-CoA dehydrogenase family protein, partial [Microbacteriaceae bacterium]|nr:acyl-CoA dehydrogenase family protein [Microbacteriaceae bacterium]